MREIIHIQVGQCGNQIGHRFWETLITEHGLSPDGHPITSSSEDLEAKRLDKIRHSRLNVYFTEGANKRWVPRSLCCDLEPGTIEALKKSEIGKIFKPESLINGTNGAGNNWAKGFYTEGADLYSKIEEQLRRESEACDQLQGFQITHSLGGGTGSGMGALIIDRIKEGWPDRLVNTFSVFPSPFVSGAVVESYNTVLSIHQLIENADSTFVLDNHALTKICKEQLNISTPDFASINKLVSRTMSAVTCSLRFPGQLNSDLRKLAVNLIPFPRLHFLTSSIAPLFSRQSREYATQGVKALTSEMFKTENIMCAIEPKNGRFLTASAIFRGMNLSSKEVEETMRKVQKDGSANFIEWIPNNIKTTLCNIPTAETENSAAFIGNTTAMQTLFRRAKSNFTKMYEKKAFLHWYTGEGMDELEFTEAESNINDLVKEYNQYQEATLEDGDEEVGESNVGESEM